MHSVKNTTILPTKLGHSHLDTVENILKNSHEII